MRWFQTMLKQLDCSCSALVSLLSFRSIVLFCGFAFFISFCHFSFSEEAATTKNVPQGKVQIAWPEKKSSDQKMTPTKPAPRPAFPGKKVEKPAEENEDIFNLQGVQRPSLIIQGSAIVLMSLMPFLIMTLSSFVKIVVVLSLLRSALGVQQAPPNQVINGIAFLLSIYVMFPTVVKMYDAASDYINSSKAPMELFSADSAGYVVAVAARAKEPLREFLKNNSSPTHQKSFYQSVYRMLPEKYRDSLTPQDFMVVVPAFITSQLKSAFEIGVLIYIPFFVIDLVVSNILLAMGMMMLSPVTISMPLKLFLLVMLDGWTLLIEGLVSTFR